MNRRTFFASLLAGATIPALLRIEAPTRDLRVDIVAHDAASPKFLYVDRVCIEFIRDMQAIRLQP